MEMDQQYISEPVSPAGQYLNSSVLSISIINVWEAKEPIDDSQVVWQLRTHLLPISPRFSSIMVIGKHGKKRWKRVQVIPEEHVKVPVFPTGLTPNLYDEHLENYISEIAMEPFPQSRPLWEIHIFKYPTSNAAGNWIFKLHHSLGDGFSLMGALLSCLKRADDPSLPPTLPSLGLNARRRNIENQRNSLLSTVSKFFSLASNTISDIFQSITKSTLIKDDQSPIWSGNDGVEFSPFTTTTITFSLHDIKQIKLSLNVTINDVITGIIFFGSRLYMEEVSKGKSNKTDPTALVLLNTRMIRSYKSVQEMLRPNTNAPWGNLFAFLHVPFPKLSDTNISSEPLEFIRETHKTIKRKRRSAAVYFMGCFYEIIRKVRGHEAVAKLIYKTIKNSSMGISNIIGPVEQVAFENQIIKGMYFIVVGVPQSVSIGILSYNESLRLAVTAEKNFIDAQKFKASVVNAFEIMFKAACKNPP
ncbi:hypothetical protein SLE2022_234310 [Rubroshorea leprosula]